MTPLLKLGFCPPIDQPREKKELAEQIIPYAASVEVEVEVGRGKTVAESVKKIGVTERNVSMTLRQLRNEFSVAG